MTGIIMLLFYRSPIILPVKLVFTQLVAQYMNIYLDIH
jgi:hypothetical protein